MEITVYKKDEKKVISRMGVTQFHPNSIESIREFFDKDQTRDKKYYVFVTVSGREYTTDQEGYSKILEIFKREGVVCLNPT